MNVAYPIQIKEVWRDVKGLEGFYQVSNIGRIKSLVGWNGHKYVRREKIILPTSDKEGRMRIKLYKFGEKINLKIHRVIAEAFIPNPNGYKVINHIDSNPSNNDISNLEWCTQKQNVIHGYRFGKHRKIQKPLKRGRLKLDKRDKYGIDLEVLRHQIKNGATNKELAEIYGCPNTLIARRRYQFKKGEI